MKNKPILILIISLLITFSLKLYAEDKFLDLIQPSDDTVEVSDSQKTDNQSKYDLSSSSEKIKNDVVSNFSAGQTYEVGTGTNYGGIIGATINVDLNSNTEIFAGFGLGLGGVGYVIGSKLWLNEKVRLSGNYGYNCTVKTISTTTTYKGYNGFNVGIGYARGGSESNGVTVDLMIVDTSDCHDAAQSTKSSSAVKISAGYRF